MKTSTLPRLNASLLAPLMVAAAFAGACDTSAVEGSFDATEELQQRSHAGLTGLLVSGEQCTENEQCMSGRCDGPAGENTCRSTLAIGDTCNENSDCGSGRCDGSIGQQTCHTAMQYGESCNENSDCESGRCDGFEEPTTCHSPQGIGDSCNEDSDCSSGRCDGPDGLQTCHSKMALGEELCNEDSDCTTNICNSVEQVCHDVPPGIVAAGGECTYEQDCDSGTCEAGICKGDLGVRCTLDNDCDSGYCTADHADDADEGICVSTNETDKKAIDPDAWDMRLNELDFAGCHNCYEPENASGLQTYREVVRWIPALELDVLKYGNGWLVRHYAAFEEPGYYSELDDYFTEIQRTLANDDYQFPIIVNLDIKNTAVSGQGGEGESLNALIEAKFGDYVFTKNDLAAFNDLDTSTDFANPAWNSFRGLAAERANFWPRPIDDALRNKVIFVVNHLSRGELDDVREYNTLFLGPSFEYDHNVWGEIGNYVADGQTVFANLAEDSGDCEGDLPEMVREARILGRCWDSNDSKTFTTQWTNGAGIGTDHDVLGQSEEYRIQPTLFVAH